MSVERLFGSEDPAKGGEFAGADGIIQTGVPGAEHDYTDDASESLTVLRAQDEDDLRAAIEAMKPRA